MRSVEIAFAKWRAAHEEFIAAERELAFMLSSSIQLNADTLRDDVKFKRVASDELLAEAMRLLSAHSTASRQRPSMKA